MTKSAPLLLPLAATAARQAKLRYEHSAMCIAAAVMDGFTPAPELVQRTRALKAEYLAAAAAVTTAVIPAAPVAAPASDVAPAPAQDVTPEQSRLLDTYEELSALADVWGVDATPAELRAAAVMFPGDHLHEIGHYRDRDTVTWLRGIVATGRADF